MTALDVKSLYIIRRDTGVCLYHKDFTESVFDPQLISSFLVAMTSFFDETTQSVNSKARAFEGTDYKIIVEFGAWTLGALSVENDRDFLREHLKSLISKFEEQFSLLKFIDLDLAIQTRFEGPVIEEFIRYQIDEQTIIRPRLNWDMFTRNAEVRAFLNLIQGGCSVKEAAEFLEIPVELALNLTARALWEKSITVVQPVKPDDIYQATTLLPVGAASLEISDETAQALRELDGETPLSMAAERVKTADLRRFLDEIAVLAQRKAVERVSPSQARLVLYTAVTQTVLSRVARILGVGVTRKIFFESRKALSGPHSWLLFVDLGQGINVDVRSSLATASIKGRVSPDMLADGFRALLQFVTKRASRYTGSGVVNSLLRGARVELEEQFPSTLYDIEWEHITAD